MRHESHKTANQSLIFNYEIFTWIVIQVIYELLVGFAVEMFKFQLNWS